MKTNFKIILITSNILCVTALQVNAQHKISLLDATEMAIKNNLLVKNEKLKSLYQEKLIEATKYFPSTNFGLDIGQINSNYLDNKIYASQTIVNSKINKSQKNLQTLEWQNALLNIGIQEAVLKKAVALVYNQLQFLIAKENILKESKKMYDEFYKKSNLRLQKGESNILEKTTADLQKGNTEIQIMQLKEQQQLYQIQLQLLLNTVENYTPIDNFDLMTLHNLIDTNIILEHPLLKPYEQQKKIISAQEEIEKTKLLPMYNIGYSNGSIRGVGADEKMYNGWNRFHSAQIGVSIPLFKTSIHKKIEAYKFSESITNNEMQIQKNKLTNEYEALIIEYKNNLEIVNFYKNNIIANTKIVEETATKQFINGEINYLDWVVLVNQSVKIKNEYLDAIKLCNENIVSLNFLISK